jgi:predicted nucleotidyltransferase component of viral defense system
VKEEALALVENLDDPARALNLLREYLQMSILRSLHESEAFKNLSFVGGTALRLIYDHSRFSEDLDFSLDQASGYQPRNWMAKLKRELRLGGFDATVSFTEGKTVHAAWVRVTGLLEEAGLAGRKEQKLSVKLEIDTRPPAGAVSSTEVITRRLMFVVRRHDLPSLMAGKIHALLARAYPKGRDWYDLVWYLSKRPPVTPNLVLLQNALDQTEGGDAIDGGGWAQLLHDRLESLDMAALAADVRPFLERPADVQYLTTEHLQTLLQR